MEGRTNPDPDPDSLVLQLYAFWAEPKNYVDVTRCWYGEHLPFPLNFFLPGQMQRRQLAKLCLQRGQQSLEVGEELEKEVSLGGARSPRSSLLWAGPASASRFLPQLYRDAAECMNLLSQRLGSHKFFFGDS